MRRGQPTINNAATAAQAVTFFSDFAHAWQIAACDVRTTCPPAAGSPWSPLTPPDARSVIRHHSLWSRRRSVRKALMLALDCVCLWMYICGLGWSLTDIA